MTTRQTSSYFYVYLLIRPNGETFYVGKGTGNRVDQHEKEARTDCQCHKCRVIRKIWRNGGAIQKRIILETGDEQKALDYEAELIDQIGLGRLTNVKPGGGKGQFFFPDTTLDKTTEQDFVRYLHNVPRTKREFDRALRDWRVRKLEMLKQDWGNFRRQRRFDQAELLIPEIERLRIVLGIVTQEDMDL